jgi:uncharacterized protein
LPEALWLDDARPDPQSPPSIALVNSGITAFVGRCLRGPLNEPTPVGSLQDFQRSFGGLWQPSMLSYAVEQFFGQGGREALIVRVANGARAATIELPASAGALRLVGLVPGTREYLRAAVDYDGVTDADRFNLTVQRLLAPDTEQIESQESFRLVSWRAGAENNVADALLRSKLVRLADSDCGGRPRPTWRVTSSGHHPYVAANADGSDGARLSDYDLIGAADALSGLQALRATNLPFSLLCLPPLDRAHDVGIAALVVAARICRKKHALLLIDPPAAWSDTADATEGLRAWPLQSIDACMFFPRVLMPDRQRGSTECFGNTGAVAGMLARADDLAPLPAVSTRLQLRAPLQPAGTISDETAAYFNRLGVNTLRSAPAALVTMASEPQSRPGDRSLRARRLAQLLAASIERGTRWALLEQSGAALWSALTAQVLQLLERVRAQGGMAGAGLGDGYQVVCDARLNTAETRRRGELLLLYGIATSQPGQFDVWLVRHGPAGSSARPVSANAWQFAGGNVA